MESVVFTVHGDPRPLARHRSRVARGGGGQAFVHTYEPNDNKINRSYVRRVAADAMHGRNLFEGPLSVEFLFLINTPASKRVVNISRVRPDILLSKSFPAVKPDLDNLIKLVCDACNKVVWRDDTLICDIIARKRYVRCAPHTFVKVRSLTIQESGEQSYEFTDSNQYDNLLVGV